jgi:hypothetical protein
VAVVDVENGMCEFALGVCVLSFLSWSGFVVTDLYPPDAWERKGRNDHGNRASLHDGQACTVETEKKSLEELYGHMSIENRRER